MTMEPLTQAQVDAYLAGRLEMKSLLHLSADDLAKLRGRAQFFYDGHHDERALIMLEMLEELDRHDTLPTLMAIDVLLRLGRSDSAEEKIDRLLARDPTDADALVAQAELHLACGRLVPAAAILAQVIERDPDTKTAAGQRARVVAARGYALVGGPS
jgi:predicted Zn-dependent protease